MLFLPIIACYIMLTLKMIKSLHLRLYFARVNLHEEGEGEEHREKPRDEKSA